MLLTGVAMAAPYAAMVIDARSGEVLHSRNADTRLHPASLTKMMTLYVAFEAIANGEISLDTQVRISRNAAAEPCSCLGLRAGQRIRLRYLIRAAAIKSGNDAATAIGEAIEGSEAAFARRMTRTARALGMSRTTFRNAHGLTEAGHLSTARDMTTLGRHLFYDYPDYYNLFSRITADAGVRQVTNTNRRLLGSYRGADGIKTGYTRAAGSNLVASAERGSERIIATMFGGSSSAARNARVAELLDMGFQRAPTRVAVRRPARPQYAGSAARPATPAPTVTAVTRSLIPVLRPVQVAAVEPEVVAPDDDLLQALEAEIASAVEEIQAAEAAPEPEAPVTEEIAVADAETAEDVVVAEALQEAPQDDADIVTAAVAAAIGDVQDVDAVPARFVPAEDTPRPVINTIVPEARPVPQEPVVITRLSGSGNQDWGVSLGKYGSQFEAERVLLRTALAETSALNGTLRRVRSGNGGYEARFTGLSEDRAQLACRRLQARAQDCEVVRP
ncbi:serine hydrolase [Thalassobius sp. I31.1]|uniref:D-alanyl-D-alanine carboxypeptidase family protein n=1 Tax=Thalassobius sp. I31.1 TaxID=2109912 RepID=UPI001E2DAB5F|nr:serine hydrolase [Thalassobius sp. I31.1]